MQQGIKDVIARVFRLAPEFNEEVEISGFHPDCEGWVRSMYVARFGDPTIRVLRKNHSVHVSCDDYWAFNNAQNWKTWLGMGELAPTGGWKSSFYVPPGWTELPEDMRPLFKGHVLPELEALALSILSGEDGALNRLVEVISISPDSFPEELVAALRSPEEASAPSPASMPDEAEAMIPSSLADAEAALSS